MIRLVERNHPKILANIHHRRFNNLGVHLQVLQVLKLGSYHHQYHSLRLLFPNIMCRLLRMAVPILYELF
jgi:hypothetical protein